MTGFYYVSSRYYDPDVGRFISADTTDILGVSNNLYDKNLYAYCDNNPVMREDITGKVWDTALDVASFAAGIADVASNPNDVGMDWLCGRCCMFSITICNWWWSISKSNY